MNREWLTLGEKKEKLNDLYELENKDLDLNFLPYLERINQLSGMCTTQSCTGHRKKDGYISLRFEYKTHELFMNEIIHLLKTPEILDVQEKFEIFGKKVRQRSVIFFKHYHWHKTIEKIIRILKKIEKKRD